MAREHIAQRAITEIQQQGFCVLRNHFDPEIVEACRGAFWPRLLGYLRSGCEGNRGTHRHFLPMPFDRPCFTPEFFFDADVLKIVRGLMDERVVADEWGCDVPVRGSEYQQVHVDYQRPLFPELPELVLPPFAMVVSFGLVRIAQENGPIEIAPRTHRMPINDALRMVEARAIELHAVMLEIGDVLIRHPWALHRGTPNVTDTPRALLTVRYVRRWYADGSRDVEMIPRDTWESLAAEQRAMMRFPIGQR